MGISNVFRDEFVVHGIDVLRFTEHTRRRVVGLFEKMLVDLRDQIHRFDLEDVKRDAFKRRRAEALIKNAEAIIANAYGTMEGRLTNTLREFARVEAQFMGAAALEAFGTQAAFRIGIGAAEARELVKSSTVLGGPAKEYWLDQGTTSKRRFARAIRVGVTQNETNRQLINRILGKATGRRLSVEDARGKTRIVREYTGGVMDASRREVNTLTRTSVQTVSNNVLMETYEANADILRGVQAIVTLDGRTSLICIARSGGVWSLDGPALPESTTTESFPGPPPWHYNCRTLLLPITKSWDELLNEETGRPSVQRLNSVPDAKRASVDGQVAGNLNYPDWLRTRSVDQQRKILGSGRYELWNDGKLNLHQMLDQTGNPLSLEQLRIRIGGN